MKENIFEDSALITYIPENLKIEDISEKAINDYLFLYSLSLTANLILDI